MIRFAALVVICGICFGACADQAEKLFIDSAQVASINIAKHGAKPRPLNKQDVAKFIRSLNGASSVGLCKYAPEYWVNLRLNNGREIEFRANGRTIKADNDYCFSVTEADLFHQLWSASENQS
ncbi:MAG: hypothetical protein ACOY9D_02420 [Pseudomonadota bacterium]